MHWTCATCTCSMYRREQLYAAMEQWLVLSSQRQLPKGVCASVAGEH